MGDIKISDGKDLTLLYLKSDKCPLADVFEKIIRISIEEHGIFFIFCQPNRLHLAMWFEKTWK